MNSAATARLPTRAGGEPSATSIWRKPASATASIGRFHCRAVATGCAVHQSSSWPGLSRHDEELLLLRRGDGARRDAAAGAVALVDIVDHHRLELGSDVGAAQGTELLAIYEQRRGRSLDGARQGDADNGTPGFAGGCDDTNQDRDVP